MIKNKIKQQNKIFKMKKIKICKKINYYKAKFT